jgi:hypothetical protein
MEMSPEASEVRADHSRLTEGPETHSDATLILARRVLAAGW